MFVKNNLHIFGSKLINKQTIYLGFRKPGAEWRTVTKNVTETPN